MVSLSLLIGLPVMTVLGGLGFLLKWLPRALWRGVFIGGCVFTLVYFVWAAWRVFTLP